MPKRLYIETVGCQMNMLDSELVVASLRKAGYALVDTPAVRRTLSDRDVASILGSLCLAYALEERYDEAFADLPGAERGDRLLGAPGDDLGAGEPQQRAHVHVADLKRHEPGDGRAVLERTGRLRDLREELEDEREAGEDEDHEDQQHREKRGPSMPTRRVEPAHHGQRHDVDDRGADKAGEIRDQQQAEAGGERDGERGRAVAVADGWRANHTANLGRWTRVPCQRFPVSGWGAC